MLHQVQLDLFEVGAHLASPGTSRFLGVDPERIAELETAIDAMEQELDPLRNFILPAGSAPAAQLHVARTVCRRAERLVVALQDDSPATLSTIAYLKRLSDYLVVAARFANRRAGWMTCPRSGEGVRADAPAQTHGGGFRPFGIGFGPFGIGFGPLGIGFG